MNPLPKYVSYLSIVAAVFGALNTAQLLALVSKDIGTIIMLGAVITSSLSHALTGAGGAATFGDK